MLPSQKQHYNWLDTMITAIGKNDPRVFNRGGVRQHGVYNLKGENFGNAQRPLTVGRRMLCSSSCLMWCILYDSAQWTRGCISGTHSLWAFCLIYDLVQVFETIVEYY